MRDFESVLYFAKVGEGERHSIRKVSWPDDRPRLARDARLIMEDMRERRGKFWRLHGSWSTGMEIWESPHGDHDLFTPPDRLVAYALWGDEDMTFIDPGYRPPEDP
jgi:hypothetical protein